MPARVTVITFLIFFLTSTFIAVRVVASTCPKDKISIKIFCLESQKKLAFRSHEGLYFLENEFFDPQEKTMVCKYKAHEWQSKYLLRDTLKTVSTDQQNSSVRFASSLGDLNNLLSEIHHMDSTQRVENFFELKDPSVCLKYSFSTNYEPPVFRSQFVHLGLDIAFQNETNEVSVTNENISTRIILNQKLLDEEKNLAASTYETGSRCVVYIE